MTPEARARLHRAIAVEVEILRLQLADLEKTLAELRAAQEAARDR